MIYVALLCVITSFAVILIFDNQNSATCAVIRFDWPHTFGFGDAIGIDAVATGLVSILRWRQGCSYHNGSMHRKAEEDDVTLT